MVSRERCGERDIKSERRMQESKETLWRTKGHQFSKLPPSLSDRIRVQSKAEKDIQPKANWKSDLNQNTFYTLHTSMHCKVSEREKEGSERKRKK